MRGPARVVNFAGFAGENAHRGRAAYSRKMRKSSRKRRIIVESESSEAEIEESQRLPVESDDET